MDEEIKSNVLSSEIWIRLVLILLFGVITSVSLWLVWLVTAVQFLFALFTGKPNQNLGEFADGLSAYIGEMLAFVMFRSDYRPFPFSPLPGVEGANKTSKATSAKAKTARKPRASSKSKAEKASEDSPSAEEKPSKPAGE